MVEQKSRLYLLTGIVCFFGGIWLLINPYMGIHGTVCPVKAVTGYPCPSCGSTRAIHLLFEGRFTDAVMLNPLGIVSLLLLVFIVTLLVIDIVAKKDFYYRSYEWLGKVLREHRKLSAVLIVLVIVNWIWNIHKGL